MAWLGGALLVVLAPPLSGGGKVEALAGRYAYGAALGWGWLVSLGADWLGRTAGKGWGWAVLGAAVAGYGAATRSHADEFQSERAMWEASVRRNPMSRLACHNAVQAMRRDGDVEEALGWLSEHVRALGKNPFSRREADGKTVVAVAGDSVPYGWADGSPRFSLSLAARLGKRAAGAGEAGAWEFVNWAVPGSTLAGLRTVLSKRLRENAADWCVVMTGHNDAMGGADADEMVRAGQDALVECLLGGARPLWVGPVPVHSAGERDREVQAATLEAFGRRMSEVCASNGVVYLDFAGRAAAAGGGWVEEESGVHLNHAGMENLAGFVFWEGLKKEAGR